MRREYYLLRARDSSGRCEAAGADSPVRSTRHLDDAIYVIDSYRGWDARKIEEGPEILALISVVSETLE